MVDLWLICSIAVTRINENDWRQVINIKQICIKSTLISDIIHIWSGIIHRNMARHCTGRKSVRERPVHVGSQHTESGQWLLVHTGFGVMFRVDSLFPLALPVYDIYGVNTEKIN